MSEYRAAYQGDEVVDRLLRKAGSPYGAADLPGLLAGVVGAPEPADPEAWIDLVASNASDALKAQLRAYRAERATEASHASPAATTARVAALRAELQRRGLAGFIVPRADEHQGEYVPPRAAARLADRLYRVGRPGDRAARAAAVFVDGRYTLAGGGAGRHQRCSRSAT